MSRYRCENEEPDYGRLNGIGGWLIFLIIRLAMSAASSGAGVVEAAKRGSWGLAALYALTFLLAGGTVALIFLRKKELRFVYCAFSAASLLDYFLAQDGTAFVACMVVEAGWIFYLFASARVKLLLGEMKPPDSEE